MLTAAWYPIERALGARHAGVLVPLGATLINAAIFLCIAAWRGDPLGGRRLAWTLGGSVLVGLMARAAVWTWRRTCRAPRGEWERVVHDLGVRRFGVMMALLMPAGQAFMSGYVERARGADVAMQAFIAAFWFTLVISVTMGLWAGYWWGRMMAAAAGLKPPGGE